MPDQTTRTGRGGFTLLEVVFALIVFAMMGLVFGAVLPVMLRGSRASSTYAQAAALAQHKLDQVRGAGFTVLQSPAALAARGVVDAGTGSGVPYTVSFAASDALVGVGGLFPPGSTATLSVADYATLNPAVPAGSMDNVTVTIAWPAGANPAGSYTVSGLVIQMPHS